MSASHLLAVITDFLWNSFLLLGRVSSAKTLILANSPSVASSAQDSEASPGGSNLLLVLLFLRWSMLKIVLIIRLIWWLLITLNPLRVLIWLRYLFPCMVFICVVVLEVQYLLFAVAIWCCFAYSLLIIEIMRAHDVLLYFSIFRVLVVSCFQWLGIIGITVFDCMGATHFCFWSYCRIGLIR